MGKAEKKQGELKKERRFSQEQDPDRAAWREQSVPRVCTAAQRTGLNTNAFDGRR
ncbi:MAG: hypothetical protein JSV99_00465 [Planctomycetota bacterium]|nr:MAG: hypothetical protein JSV99_00465 [Planctomycetota bacterium]